MNVSIVDKQSAIVQSDARNLRIKMDIQALKTKASKLKTEKEIDLLRINREEENLINPGHNYDHYINLNKEEPLKFPKVDGEAKRISKLYGEATKNGF